MRILMPALSRNLLLGVMARPGFNPGDRSIQRAHVHARHESYVRLGGPLLRAMTAEVA
jgi:hypothetical protein